MLRYSACYGWAADDTSAFRDSVPSETVGVIVLLTTRALAADDLSAAREWFSLLEDLAPDDPRTAEVCQLMPANYYSDNSTVA
jgi:hypothetical protein